MAKDAILVGTITGHKPVVLLEEHMTATNCKLDSVLDAGYGLWSVHLCCSTAKALAEQWAPHIGCAIVINTSCSTGDALSIVCFPCAFLQGLCRIVPVLSQT
jgi:hypothetical protein